MRILDSPRSGGNLRVRAGSGKGGTSSPDVPSSGRPSARSAAAALWFGFAHLLDYLLYASLFGGALTLLLLGFREMPLPYRLVGQDWLLKLHDKETGIPYGIALATGALLVYPQTEWISAVDLSRFAFN